MQNVSKRQRGKNGLRLWERGIERGRQERQGEGVENRGKRTEGEGEGTRKWEGQGKIEEGRGEIG